jgi:hypothetical protein
MISASTRSATDDQRVAIVELTRSATSRFEKVRFEKVRFEKVRFEKVRFEKVGWERWESARWEKVKVPEVGQRTAWCSAPSADPAPE